MDTVESKQAFLHLKPLCNQIMKNPEHTNIRILVDEVSKLSPAILEDVHPYIIFPLIANLKLPKNKTKYECQRWLIDGIKEIMKRIKINSLDIFIKYHTIFLDVIFDKSKPGSVSDVPEELKLSVVETITIMLLNIKDDVRAELYKANQIPIVAPTIYVCVNMSKTEQMRALKKASIDCIRCLTTTHDSYLNEDYSLKCKVLEPDIVAMLRNILPGVLAALQDVALSTYNQGHAIVASAVSTIHRILCMVMNDKHLEVCEADVSVNDFVKLIDKKNNASAQQEVPMKSCKNNTEWCKQADRKLEVVIKVLSQLQSHEHVNVRRELAIFASRLLLECSRSMPSSIPHVIDILIALKCDECETISQYSIDKLNQYFESNVGTRHSTVQCLASNFFKKLALLPRIINDIDSRNKNSTLSLISGYIEILDATCDNTNKLTQLLLSESNVQVLCDTLVQVCSLDNSGYKLLQEISFRDINQQERTSQLYLRHIDNTQTLNRLHCLLMNLGTSQSCDLLIDHLIQSLNQSSENIPEILYLLNYIGSAKAKSPSINKEHLIQRIIETYIEPELWYRPLEISTLQPDNMEQTQDIDVYKPNAWDKDYTPGLYEGAIETRYTDISYQNPRVCYQRDPDKCRTVQEAQYNLAIMCLLTEGLGMFADMLGVKYQRYLLKSLTLILERVGSSYRALHCSGVQCLHRVSSAFKHENPGELIKQNSDYFTHYVTVKLKKVLLKKCDNYSEKATIAFLELFLSFINCLMRWYPEQFKRKKYCCHSNALDLTKLTIDEKKYIETEIVMLTKEFIANVRKSKDLADSSIYEDEFKQTAEEMYKEDQLRKNNQDPLDYDDKISEPEKLMIPQHVEMTITILKRSINFIASKNMKQKILAMQIMNEGLLILQDFEDELLPMVHQIWAPLVERFYEMKELLAVYYAFNLLVTMCHCGKDFIRNRTIKEVLPALCEFLHKSSKDSYLKDTGSIYRQSDAYRLQECMLKHFSCICINLELDEQYLYKVMECSSHYLSCKQPKPLQELAMMLFKLLQSYDNGATWHYLRSLCSNSDLLIFPHSDLDIKIPDYIGTPYRSNNNDFNVNLSLILKR